MNERIDKMMVKAGAYFGGEGVDYSNFDPKKFAELIVRECKQVLLDMIDEGQGEFDTLDQALTEINEHFGVEE